jgi:hypothetical protein
VLKYGRGIYSFSVDLIPDNFNLQFVTYVPYGALGKFLPIVGFEVLTAVEINVVIFWDISEI